MSRLRNKVALLVFIFLLAIISFGALVPHPNTFYESEYTILASNLNEKSANQLIHNLHSLRLSYHISKDRKEIKVPEKVLLFYTYQNGSLTSSSLRNKIITKLINASASLKAYYWGIMEIYYSTEN